MNISNVTGKFIVFSIADYLLSLPISDVLKVVSYPFMNSEDFKAAGLIHIGQHTITLLNLHQKLTNIYDLQVNNSPFLVITQVQGELCAIPVNEPPNLVELPRNSIRVLPKSYHHQTLANLAKYVAVVSEEEKTFTIFILDLNQVLTATMNITTSHLIVTEK